MNKKYVILILTTVFILIPNMVKAEEVTCEYILNDNGYKSELNITYNDDTEDYNYSYTTKNPYVDNDKIELKFDYDKFKSMVASNSSGLACPYKLVGYKISLENTDAFYRLYTSYEELEWWESLLYKIRIEKKITFACQNCSDGLGNMVIFDPEEYTTCDGILGTRLVNFINTIFDYVKVLVPVALIALGSFDIGRAIFAGNEDEMKKATKTFIRRLIIAVIIMFSPLLVNFIINVVNNATGSGYSGTCGIN